MKRLSKKQVVERLCKLLLDINKTLNYKYSVDCFCGNHIPDLVSIDNIDFKFDEEFLTMLESELERSMKLLTDKVIQDIISELRSGRKIMAIKKYREYTGYGLKESKDFVDNLEKGFKRKYEIEEENDRNEAEMPF